MKINSMESNFAKHFYAHFSLFHHDISKYLDGSSNLSQKQLEILDNNPSADETDIASVLIEIIEESLKGIENGQIGLTLTGGFDSRVILSVLLAMGKRPICFTYGNPENRDVKISSDLCRTFNLKHVNVAETPPNAKSYLNDTIETLRVDNGQSHLHRSHRMLAIKNFTHEHKIKVLFTGHFGGEQIRGLSYNNYFSSNLFERYNENNEKLKDITSSTLDSYFIRNDCYNKDELIKELQGLNWMKKNKSKNRLYYLYDIVGMNHHLQDIRIYSNFVDNIIPVYLDKRFIEILMMSPHHFMRKKRNSLNSLSHPKLYCSMLQNFCPKLMNLELSNRYKPIDYQKGLVYYGLKRVLNKYLIQNYNIPSFAYGEWYQDFIKTNSELIDDRIWEIYDKKAYFKALNNSTHRSDEGYWHKFSNPILFDLKNKYI